jgi:hypothetical protein
MSMEANRLKCPNRRAIALAPAALLSLLLAP